MALLCLGTVTEKGQQNGMKLLQRASFGCQTFIVYCALGEESNPFGFFFPLVLTIFAVKSGGRALISLEPLSMPVHSEHQVSVSVLADKAVSAGPEQEMCCKLSVCSTSSYKSAVYLVRPISMPLSSKRN